MIYSKTLSRRLQSSQSSGWIAGVALTAFLTYCSVYGFRKPFAAASFSGEFLWGIQFKIVLVLAQVAGYALSKFIGIRLIGGLDEKQRSRYLLGSVLFAELALLGFAVTPFPWNAFWMFVNGLPLGMAWGFVFGYLEGRRSTELLAAVLCVNFIVSSGFAKTTGQWLLQSVHCPEYWMPFVAGLLFFPLLLVCVWILSHLPPPTEADVKARSMRRPMSAEERKSLFLRYAPGLVLLTGVYLVLTIVRDVRDNFAVELWSELGFSGQPAILTTAEVPVAILTLGGVAALYWIKENFRAVRAIHWMGIFGALLLACTTWLMQLHLLSPVGWMILSGFGLFLPYALFNAALFDRLLSAFRESGNVGFLMYVADAIGYLGSVLVLLWRNFGWRQESWLGFYFQLCYGAAGFILLFAFGSMVYFRQKRRQF